MLIEALTPLKVHLHDRELLLDLGHPQELADDDARRLLAKVPDKVRMVERVRVAIHPAVRPGGTALRPIYFEDVYGRILGPAAPEFLAQDGAAFWIVATVNGELRWIRSDRLRSQVAFETQGSVRVSDPIPRSL